MVVFLIINMLTKWWYLGFFTLVLAVMWRLWSPTEKIVVVGGGLAGLVTCVELVSQGHRVHLLEKEPFPGGNSRKATSGLNAVRSTDSADSVTAFQQDIMESGGGLSQEELVSSLAEYSDSALRFLETFTGLEFNEVTQLGGHSHPRTHRLPTDRELGPVGVEVVSRLLRFLKASQRFHLHTGAKLVDIALEGDRVTHISVTQGAATRRWAVQAVILATGGFGADLDQSAGLLKRVPSACETRFTTNGAFATGDSLKIAEKHHLDLVQLDQVQLHPTAFVDPQDPGATIKFLCPEMIRGEGGILLGINGRRFVNELGTRKHVSGVIADQGSTFKEWGLSQDYDRAALLLIDPHMKQRIGERAMDFYKNRGLFSEWNSVEDLCRAVPVDCDGLQRTIRMTLTDDAHLGRPARRAPDWSGPLLSAYVTPAVHYTMGGLAVDAECHVKSGSQPLQNLLAAGEVTGGLHGENRLAGNGMLESVVNGRLAAQSAIKALSKGF
ncbi:MAG: hypothetical protein KVP17_001774 [Porospora cf. gigantea B]|uniref:uncharacterized protein n=1 Tax=Porospora cf. gigantea B TaxID=2853592 RepID=UPI00357183BD|nr:MAG: hypothetical protein KVP17_001774 [Porospora cf. gigantea B]